MAGVEWKQVSSEGKDFVKKLLVIDMDHRMTIEEAINHAWINRKLEILKF